MIAKGQKYGCLYLMDIKGIAKQDQAYMANNGCTWDQWHRIFGHLNMGSVKMLKDKNMVNGMEVDTMVEPQAQCQPCIIAKQHVKSYPWESHMCYDFEGHPQQW